MRLDQLTWQEVETYLQGSKGIILPIGSTEQHGPTGLIGTDALCADLVARGVGERASAMVAPPLNFGMAQHHMAFAGSMTLRPETMLAVLLDLLTSIAVHGFERCLIINGHGGNMATIMAAISELHARSQPWLVRSRRRAQVPSSQLVDAKSGRCSAGRNFRRA